MEPLNTVKLVKEQRYHKLTWKSVPKEPALLTRMLPHIQTIGHLYRAHGRVQGVVSGDRKVLHVDGHELPLIPTPRGLEELNAFEKGSEPEVVVSLWPTFKETIANESTLSDFELAAMLANRVTPKASDPNLPSTPLFLVDGGLVHASHEHGFEIALGIGSGDEELTMMYVRGLGKSKAKPGQPFAAVMKLMWLDGPVLMLEVIWKLWKKTWANKTLQPVT